MAQLADLQPPSVAAHRRRSLHVIALRTGLGLIAGFALLVPFALIVNLHAVFGRLEHLSLEMTLLSGIVFLSAYVVRALRWRLFLAPYRVGRLRVIAIYQVAIFINWLLPIRAGELSKSLMLRRSDDIPISRSLATVTMDKMMDLLPAVALIALLPVVHIQVSRPLWILLLSTLALLGLGAVVVGLLAWRRDQALAWLHRLLGRVLPSGAQRSAVLFVERFADTLVALVRQPRVLFVASVYTAVAVGLDALFCFLAFRAVGVAIPASTALYGFTFYNLAYLAPTPPGQIGSNELIGLLVFSGMFGVSRSAVGAMFVFSHPWTAVLMATSAIVCLSSMGLSLRATLRLSQATEPVGGE